MVNTIRSTPPDASEHTPYYGRYTSLVSRGDILDTLAQQCPETIALLSTLSDEQANYRYAPGKWSIKEMLGHVVDTERVFAYRALRIARNDQTPIEGFDQDDYVRGANFSKCRLTDMLDEFACVRRASILLFQQLSAEAWLRRGSANQMEISVRALAYVVAGHEIYHRNALKEKYLSGVAAHSDSNSCGPRFSA